MPEKGMGKKALLHSSIIIIIIMMHLFPFSGYFPILEGTLLIFTLKKESPCHKTKNSMQISWHYSKVSRESKYCHI